MTLAIRRSTTWCTLNWFSKVPIWVWAVIGIAIGAVLWLRQHDNAVRAEERAKVAAQASDSLKQEVEKRDSALAKQDREIEVQRTALVKTQQSLATKEASAKRETSAAVATLRSQLNDEMKALLDSVINGYNRQLAVKDSMIQVEQRMRQLADSQAAARAKQIESLRRLNESIEAALAIERKRGNRTLVQKVIQIAPWAAIAYGAGRLQSSK